MSDPKLVEVARTVETGHPLPLLRLSTPGQLVIGTPGPSAGFQNAVWDPLIQEVGQKIRREQGGLAAFTRKRELQKREALEQRWDEMAAALREGWGKAAVAPEPDPPENLTLYSAVVWAWGEQSGLRVPAVRIRIDSVSAWWPCPAEVLKGQGGGGGWFAFVSVPLDVGN